MRALTFLQAGFGFVLWGIGVGLFFLAIFSGQGYCSPSAPQQASGCLPAGVSAPLLMVVGLAVLLIGFAVISRLPFPLVARRWGPGPRGVLVPFHGSASPSGGLGVWVPSHSVSLRERRPVRFTSSSRGPSRSFSARARVLPRSGPPSSRAGFSTYATHKGSVFLLPGGLGVWVPAAQGPLRTRTPQPRPRTDPSRQAFYGSSSRRPLR